MILLKQRYKASLLLKEEGSLHIVFNNVPEVALVMKFCSLLHQQEVNGDVLIHFCLNLMCKIGRVALEELNSPQSLSLYFSCSAISEAQLSLTS